MIRRFLITVSILVILFHGFHASWETTFYGIMGIGLLMCVVRAVFDAGQAIGNAMHREQHNYNMNVTEQHSHGDPTGPDREALPAVIELRRERGKQ